MATITHSVADSKENVTIPPKKTQKTQPKMKYPSPNVIHLARCTKLRTVGTELMRQMTPEGRNENSPFQPTKSVNNPYPPRPSANKLKSPHLRLREKVDARAYTIEDTPNRYEEDFLTECNEEPTQDWQRRWNVGMILRHNARHPEDPTLLPQWITESPDNYATLKRPLPVSKRDNR